MTTSAIIITGVLLGLCLAFMQDAHDLRKQNAQLEAHTIELLERNRALVEHLDNRLTGE